MVFWLLQIILLVSALAAAVLGSYGGSVDMPPFMFKTSFLTKVEWQQRCGLFSMIACVVSVLVSAGLYHYLKLKAADEGGRTSEALLFLAADKMHNKRKKKLMGMLQSAELLGVQDLANLVYYH